MSAFSQRAARIAVGCMGIPMLYFVVDGLARGRIVFPSRYHPAYIAFAQDPKDFVVALAFWSLWGLLLMAIGLKGVRAR